MGFVVSGVGALASRWRLEGLSWFSAEPEGACASFAHWRQGGAAAPLNLGLMYDFGHGVPKDEQQAYFWWLLASVGGGADAIKFRDQIESRITPKQRAAAQADARNWKPQ